jgi:hypothetical protein
VADACGPMSCGLRAERDSLPRSERGGLGGTRRRVPPLNDEAIELAAARMRGEVAPDAEALARAAEVIRGS